MLSWRVIPHPAVCVGVSDFMLACVATGMNVGRIVGPCARVIRDTRALLSEVKGQERVSSDAQEPERGEGGGERTDVVEQSARISNFILRNRLDDEQAEEARRDVIVAIKSGQEARSELELDETWRRRRGELNVRPQNDSSPEHVHRRRYTLVSLLDLFPFC